MCFAKGIKTQVWRYRRHPCLVNEHVRVWEDSPEITPSRDPGFQAGVLTPSWADQPHRSESSHSLHLSRGRSLRGFGVCDMLSSFRELLLPSVTFAPEVLYKKFISRVTDM